MKKYINNLVLAVGSAGLMGLGCGPDVTNNYFGDGSGSSNGSINCANLCETIINKCETNSKYPETIEHCSNSCEKHTSGEIPRLRAEGCNDYCITDFLNVMSEVFNCVVRTCDKSSPECDSVVDKAIEFENKWGVKIYKDRR